MVLFVGCGGSKGGTDVTPADLCCGADLAEDGWVEEIGADEFVQDAGQETGGDDLGGEDFEADDADLTDDALSDVAADVPPDDLPADLGTDAGETPDAEEQPCQQDYDCGPGQSCVLGFCEPFEPDCEEDDDCPEGQKCVEGLCLDEGTSPLFGKLVFNEVLTDGSTDGDPNGDGSINDMEDEFVEIVNVSNEPVDIGGFKLVEKDWLESLPRHVFEDGFMVQPMEALVVFGGGDAPESQPGVFFDVSNAADPGDAYGLDLDDTGDRVLLLDHEDLVIAAFAYGDEGGVPAVSDQSLTRSPDLIGAFVPHTTAPGSDSAPFSPGTAVNGQPF